MRCTYRAFGELGRSMGIGLLVAHAAVAALVLGPALWPPMLLVAGWLVTAAVLLVRRHPSNVPALTVALVLAFDGVAVVSAAA